jgi:hypothetical protein
VPFTARPRDFLLQVVHYTRLIQPLIQRVLRVSGRGVNLTAYPRPQSSANVKEWVEPYLLHSDICLRAVHRDTFTSNFQALIGDP